MLSYEELENIARLKRLPLVNAEKDYLQELILFSIYSNVGKELVFKGGTALYKIYKLNRFSEDLDFTLTKKLDTEKVANKIISDLILLNIGAKIKEIREYRNEINVRLLLKGPLYKGSKERQCFIPLNISKREQTLEPKKETIIPMFREIPSFEIFIMSEKEILAEKIRAIFTRQKPRDIYDLWFLLIKKNVSFNTELVNKKLSIYNLKFDFGNFKNKIEKMKGLWQIDLKNLILGKLPDFDKIKKEIIEKLRDKLRE
jgi:hypothetical protein